MLGEKIKEQFGVDWKRETIATNVLVLRVSDSAKLTAHLTKSKNPGNSGMGDGKTQSHTLTDQKIEATANLMETFFEKPIVDQTRSPEKYDFVFSWNERNWKSREERWQAIQESLTAELEEDGLELVPGQEPVEMLVVEKK